MVIENTGGIIPPEPRNNTGGIQENSRPQGPQEVQEQIDEQDEARVANFAEVALRTTNANIAQTQRRLISAELTANGLGEIRDLISNLRQELQILNDEPGQSVRVNQTISAINSLSDQVRFEDNPLLGDFEAESLGLTNITGETQREEVGRILNEAQSRVEDRLDEVREEETVDRRQLESLDVALENIQSASFDRIENQRDLDETVRAVREEIANQDQEPANLRPDRILDLI